MDYVQMTQMLQNKVAKGSTNPIIQLGYEKGLRIGGTYANASIPVLEEAIENGARIEYRLPEKDIPVFSRACWEAFMSRRGGWLSYHIDDCPWTEIEEVRPWDIKP